jgi:hypothetical protein
MTKPFNSETAAAAREAADAQKLIYTREFMEEDRWKELAKDAGISLPFYFARPSDSAIKSVLRRLGLSWNLYTEAYGWEDASHFERLNPKWSMRPLTGLILELWDEKRRLVEACQNGVWGRNAIAGSASPKKERMPKGVAKAKRPLLRYSLDSNDVINR